MARVICILLALLLLNTDVPAGDRILKADFRPRPPEMIVEGDRFSGPLKDILEEAAETLGYKIEWRAAPFPRSLNDLQAGRIDIIPRTIRNHERETFVSFLGPIGTQRKDILFLVRKGKEGTIRGYEHLANLRVGVKLETAYFDRFDKDTALRKEPAGDDLSLARMFVGGRFDTVAILDQSPMESTLASLNFNDYAYADYRFEQNIGNYYGMSKTSTNAALFPKLNAKLKEMMTSGRVAEIYTKFGVAPPTP